MTVIAGFACATAVLFASDTKHTYPGWMQVEAGKMFATNYSGGGRSLFALCGHVHYAKMIIQHCERALDAMDPATFTLANCRARLEQVLAEDYQTHIYPDPEPRPQMEFLAGIYSPISKRVGFFSIEETAVNRLYGYDCRGSGAYLGHFLLREPYKAIHAEVVAGRLNGDAEVRAVAANALAALNQIKSYDDSCGRATDLAWMGHDGRLSYLTRLHEDPLNDELIDVVMERLTTGKLSSGMIISRAGARPVRRRSKRDPKA